MGRNTYRPSPVLADHIRTRDGTCRFPGCRQPARNADLDHTVPHADGGPTTPGNLGALCRHHHRLKTHARGWAVTQDDRHAFTWTTPTGSTYTTYPATAEFGDVLPGEAWAQQDRAQEQVQDRAEDGAQEHPRNKGCDGPPSEC